MRCLPRGGGTEMRAPLTSQIRLLLIGAGLRLTGAALVIALLWTGFFWATSTPAAP